jgi:hypothetical protein
MNQQLKEFARATLKEGLAQLPEDWQMLFKKLYSRDNLERSMNEMVDRIPEDKLDWAMCQVENSIHKLKKQFKD